MRERGVSSRGYGYNLAMTDLDSSLIWNAVRFKSFDIHLGVVPVK